MNTRLGLYRDTASMRRTAVLLLPEHSSNGPTSYRQASTSTATDGLRDAFYRKENDDDDDGTVAGGHLRNVRMPHYEAAQRSDNGSSADVYLGDFDGCTPQIANSSSSSSRSRRMIVVELSACRPASSCLYAITGEGIVGLASHW